MVQKHIGNATQVEHWRYYADSILVVRNLQDAAGRTRKVNCACEDSVERCSEDYGKSISFETLSTLYLSIF